MLTRISNRIPMTGAALSLATLLACGESPLEPVSPTPVAVASIDVNLTAPTVARGAQLQLVATPKGAEGQVLQGRAVSWTSLEPELATVTAAGTVQGVTEGAATLRVSSEGIQRDVEVVVTAAPLGGIELSATALVLNELGVGGVTATVRNALGEVVEDVPLTWTSLSPLTALVNNGTVTALQEGTARIRVEAGDLSAQFDVFVRPVFGGDLVFTSADGPFGAMRIYRMTGATYATTRPLVDLNGFSQPAVSPDGQRIAFVCPGSGPAICVANIDGSSIVMLTSEESTYEDQPTWSPDGSKIAFRRYSAIGTVGPWNPSDIWVMNADGTSPVNLTDDGVSQHWPTWSPADAPGGVQIAFVQDSIVDGYETSRLWVMASNGSGRRAVTAADSKVEDRPQWMPGATELIFTRLGAGYQHAIRVVNVATAAERDFLATPLPPGGQFHPTVSPNGRYVVFASQHEEVSGGWVPQVYTARLDGTDVRLRSQGTHGKGWYAWVPTP